MDFSSTSHPIPTATTQSTGGTPMREKPGKRARDNSDENLSELPDVFSGYVEAYKERTTMLCRRSGHEVDASAARKRVNGELLKLPTLTREGRLRAATLIVKDNSKVDLFDSLDNNDKNAWVQMLLDGKLD